jgi:hypothetical protein
VGRRLQVADEGRRRQRHSEGRGLAGRTEGGSGHRLPDVRHETELPAHHGLDTLWWYVYGHVYQPAFKMLHPGVLEEPIPDDPHITTGWESGGDLRPFRVKLDG